MFILCKEILITKSVYFSTLIMFDVSHTSLSILWIVVGLEIKFIQTLQIFMGGHWVVSNMLCMAKQVWLEAYDFRSYFGHQIILKHNVYGAVRPIGYLAFEILFYHYSVP